MKQSVLFLCNMNSVRSPMAAALLRLHSGSSIFVDSAGIYEGGLDPFVEIVMGELGVAMDSHEPKELSGVEIEKFDSIIALTPEAAIAARKQLPKASIEFWDIENPSEERGGRDAIIESYRNCRKDIERRLRDRFPEIENNA